jgi:hypothetical protein
MLVCAGPGIAQLRPTARFIACTHSSEFFDQAANLGDGFFYVNLYDAKIDSNVVTGKRGLILIHNTYLPSFAYNLSLCWLLCAGGGPYDRKRLLKHNFKRFFGEQLLRANPNIFSRAVFLETLLYEQVCMVPVFEAKAQQPELDRLATLGSELMSSAVSFHELGHYYLGRDPGTWGQVLEQFPDTVGPLVDRIGQRYGEPFAVEFKCDVMSVASCLNQYEEKAGREFCLRATVFAFATFAVLSSLTKSAELTAHNQRAIPDDVDFASIEKRHREYEFSLGIDRDFVERARLVAEFCESLARKDGLDLFGDEGAFPLRPTIVDDMVAFIDDVMVSDDRNAREMSLLVAEALSEHPRGVDYLFLRSRTFSFGSQRNPNGSLKAEAAPV